MEIFYGYEFVDLHDDKAKLPFCSMKESNSDKTGDERRNLLRIIRGYNGLMPTKFRQLNNSPHSLTAHIYEI